MSRKYYVLIAAVLKEFEPTVLLKHIAERMADALKRDNARFNRERFLEACGL